MNETIKSTNKPKSILLMHEISDLVLFFQINVYQSGSHFKEKLNLKVHHLISIGTIKMNYSYISFLKFKQR